MGFNKKWLPELDEIKDEYKRLGHEEFRRLYFKYDAFMGLTKEKEEFLDPIMKEDKPWKDNRNKWYYKFYQKSKTMLSFIVK